MLLGTQAGSVSAQIPDLCSLEEEPQPKQTDTTILSIAIPVQETPGEDLAPEPGVTTAFLNVQAKSYNCSVPYYQANWHANTVGWKRGIVTIEADLYFQGSHYAEMRNSCGSSGHKVTSCSTPTRHDIFQPVRGGMTWTLYAEGCGRGGCTYDSKTVTRH